MRKLCMQGAIAWASYAIWLELLKDTGGNQVYAALWVAFILLLCSFFMDEGDG